jgi:hypothetical protein
MRACTLFVVFWLLTACSTDSDLPPDKYLVVIPACTLLDNETVAELTMRLPNLSTESEDHPDPGNDGITASSCRMRAEDATRTYWVNINVVRYLPHNGTSGADRARKRLCCTDNGGITGLEVVSDVSGDWGKKLVEVRDGNVFLHIEYGASPKQADRLDSKQHRDGLRRIIEDAADALRHYKNA